MTGFVDARADFAVQERQFARGVRFGVGVEDVVDDARHLVVGALLKGPAGHFKDRFLVYVHSYLLKGLDFLSLCI